MFYLVLNPPYKHYSAVIQHSIAKIAHSFSDFMVNGGCSGMAIEVITSIKGLFWLNILLCLHSLIIK